MRKLTAMLIAIAVFISPPLLSGETTFIQGSITGNSVWGPAHSPYVIQKEAVVEKGSVLTIKPGVEVRLGSEASLVVKGGLEAVGEVGQPVRFVPFAGAAAWGNLYFLGSDPAHSLLKRCVVTGGRVACSSASPTIEQCSLYGSDIAVEVGANSGPRIINNRVTANRAGIVLRTNTSSPLVYKNVFYNNSYGLYLENFGFPRVTGNLLYSNKAYNIVNRSGKELAAPWNDFRAADAEMITKTMYDGTKQAGLGKVNFTPFTPPVENRDPQAVASSQDAMESNQPKISLTLSGLYAGASGPGVPANQKTGLGNQFRLEYQFNRVISMGLNLGYMAMISSGKASYLGQMDLMGRISPIHFGGVEPYMIGGAGINPLFNAATTPWAGHYHAMAGVGTKINFTQGWGMDLAGIYDFYTPMAMHVESFSVRAGVSYGINL